jgi:hypothetical protein
VTKRFMISWLPGRGRPAENDLDWIVSSTFGKFSKIFRHLVEIVEGPEGV